MAAVRLMLVVANAAPGELITVLETTASRSAVVVVADPKVGVAFTSALGLTVTMLSTTDVNVDVDDMVLIRTVSGTDSVTVALAVAVDVAGLPLEAVPSNCRLHRSRMAIIELSRSNRSIASKSWKIPTRFHSTLPMEFGWRTSHVYPTAGQWLEVVVGENVEIS